MKDKGEEIRYLRTSYPSKPTEREFPIELIALLTYPDGIGMAQGKSTIYNLQLVSTLYSTSGQPSHDLSLGEQVKDNRGYQRERHKREHTAPIGAELSLELHDAQR